MVEWQTMQDTGARVAVRDDGVPLVVVIPTVEVEEDGQRWWRGSARIEDVQMEIEVRLGWRISTTTIAGVDDPRGWTLVVDAVGKLAVPSSYAEWRASPAQYEHHEPRLRFDELTGLNGRSGLGCLNESWKGYPRGTWVVFSAGGEGHAASVGFVRQVGSGAVVMALIGGDS